MFGQLNQNRLLVLSALFLAAFLMFVVFRPVLDAVNLSVNVWAASVNSNFFLLYAQGISLAFDAAVLATASIILAVILVAKRHGRYGALLFFAMAGDLLLVETFKTLVASARPANGVFSAVGYSFPSGHVTGNIVFFGVVSYFVWVHWCSTKARIAIASLYGVIVTVIGFDRIYLNVHWLSDVVGGVLLGAFWVSMCIFVFRQTRRCYLAKSR